MDLRTITLLAAIGQTLVALSSLVNLVIYISDLHGSGSWRSFVSWPLGILADIALAAFLFTLFAKQKKG